MRTKKSLLPVVSALCLFYHPHAAHAVPAFARQTGVECSACHVGSFGPQLTEFGREFKLNGYTLGGVKDRLKEFSAMAFGGFEHTNDTPAGGVNNHWTLDQASIFYAGALTSNLGVFSQVTYSGPDDVITWDNADVRYANTASVGGKNLVYGLTANNNPSVQDLWQTAPAWKFPFVGSSVAPGPSADAFIDTLGGTVGGVGAYSMWNNLLYTELSGYSSLWDGFQRTVGVHDVSTTDHLDGVAPYWRVALQHDFGQHYVSVGTLGMDAKRYPGNDRTAGTDHILDAGVDATYQYNAGDHNVSVYGSAIHEHDNLSATQALGGSTNSSDNLNFYNESASYYYKSTYGVTLSHFSITGSQDATLYSSGNPNSAGWTGQVDFTPTGKAGTFAYPNVNARFFVQYTLYNKLDGVSAGASGNNTLFTGVWFAF